MLYFYYAQHHPNNLSLFFFNDTATTEIYTLSLHDALPISEVARRQRRGCDQPCALLSARRQNRKDRKSTRLNSSHANISYAVFCLKKKKYRQDADTRRSETFADPELDILPSMTKSVHGAFN